MKAKKMITEVMVTPTFHFHGTIAHHQKRTTYFSTFSKSMRTYKVHLNTQEYSTLQCIKC